VDTAEDLRDAARRARECAVIGQAVALARWIGSDRRPVTPGGVLRKADVPAAGAVLGVDVPAKLRTMADVPELHRPWCVAVATGLLQVSDGSVTVGPALAGWPPDDGDLLAGWLAGLFGWDGDHLHMFEAGKKHYSSQFVPLDGAGNEKTIRVRDVMAPGGTIAYTYDFGADWQCKITLEKTVPRDHSQRYPVCVAFGGDSPVEYWDEERPRKPTPVGLDKVNRRLAALGREVA
jgi:hypothetical protein